MKIEVLLRGDRFEVMRSRVFCHQFRGAAINTWVLPVNKFHLEPKDLLAASELDTDLILLQLAIPMNTEHNGRESFHLQFASGDLETVHAPFDAKYCVTY